MSPALHRPHLAETRHTHGFGGPAPTPPPGPPCDQCGKGTSRYNPHGRCNACCQRVGYPIEPAEERKPPRPGHTDDCECFERRKPRIGLDGEQLRKGGKGGNRRWTITLTCPRCEKQREVEFGGLRVKACTINYALECMSCQKHGNTYARDHFNRQKEAA